MKLILSIITITLLSTILFIHPHINATYSSSTTYESFQVTSINNGIIKAIPIHHNSDKPGLRITLSDIKDNQHVIVGQIVHAIYKKQTGEDQFLYAIPQNEYTVLIYNE
jgi:hypothetical protein